MWEKRLSLSWTELPHELIAEVAQTPEHIIMPYVWRLWTAGAVPRGLPNEVPAPK